MKILGIMWEENSTAALMIDGEIVACASEERFSRSKNDERYPKKAVEYVLWEGGVDPRELDLIAFANRIWRPYQTLVRRYSTHTVEDALREQNLYWYPRFYQNKKPRYLEVFKDKIDLNQYPFRWKEALEFLKKDDEGLRLSEGATTKFFQDFRKRVVAGHLGVDPQKVVFIDHHSGHASHAYFSSPIRDEALVLTADAWGDNLNATVNVAKNGFLKRIHSADDLLAAHLYRYMTLLLGMKPNEHEYKVMGLAPYAKEKYFQNALKIFEETQFVKGLDFDFKKVPTDRYFYFKEKLDGQRFDAIAGALQKYTENLLIKWVKNCIKKTGLRRICFGGGVAMNVKASMEINELKEIKEIFISPSPGDESLAIGATQALMAEHCQRNNSDPKAIKPLKNSYLGPYITREEVRNLLKAIKKVKFYRVTEKASPAFIAKLLARGAIIGRAAGRSEFGARALGNRSILADPRNPDIIKIINEKIKNRDFWMPFAATILEKRAADYLSKYKQCGAPYMTLAFRTTPFAFKDLRAGLHPADLTCRPQVLRKGDNPDYEKIILAFEKLTGVGGLLNTSFNLHGEPIVQTAADAYRVFKLSDMDGLLLNDTFIEKISKNPIFK